MGQRAGGDGLRDEVGAIGGAGGKGARRAVIDVERDRIGLGRPLRVEREDLLGVGGGPRVEARVDTRHRAVGVGDAIAIGCGVPADEGVAIDDEGVVGERDARTKLEALLGRHDARVGIGVGRLVGLEVDVVVGRCPQGRDLEVEDALVAVEAAGQIDGEAGDLREVDLEDVLGREDDAARTALVPLDAPAGEVPARAIVIDGALGQRSPTAGVGGQRAERGDVGKGRLALDARRELVEVGMVARQVVDDDGFLPACEEGRGAEDLEGRGRIGGKARDRGGAVVTGDGGGIPADEVPAATRCDDDLVVLGELAVPDGLAVLAVNGALGAVLGGEDDVDALLLPLCVEVDDGALQRGEVGDVALRSGLGEEVGALDRPADPVVAGAGEAVGDGDLLAVLDGDGLREALVTRVVGVPHVAVERDRVGDGRPVRVERDLVAGHREARAKGVLRDVVVAVRLVAPAVEGVAQAPHLDRVGCRGEREDLVLHVERAVGRRADGAAHVVVAIVVDGVADDAPLGEEPDDLVLDGAEVDDRLAVHVTGAAAIGCGVPAVKDVGFLP